MCNLATYLYCKNISHTFNERFYNNIAVLFFRPFSGLISDIKRKVPWYWSDYKDGLHIQCLAAFIYVFLGTFTPNVTFGGLLGQATDQYMVSCVKPSKCVHLHISISIFHSWFRVFLNV